MGNRFFVIIFGILIAGLLSGCSGGGGGGSHSVVLKSIEVTPSQPSIARGTSVQFTAIGIYSDLSKQDLTSTVTWKSSADAIATVDAQGLVTSVAQGAANITATLGDRSKTVVLTVTPATLDSIQVYPSAASIARGTSQQFTAIGRFSDDTTQDLTTQVVWNSTVPAVSSISSAGLAASAASGSTGSTTITATLASFPGKTGTATLQVTAATLKSLEVSPANPSIAVGTTLQFKATGIFTDNTKQDLTASSSWSSSTPAVSITGGGLATGVAVGSPTITATFGGHDGTSTLTVTSASLVTIEVTPLAPSIASGTSQQFAAIGTFSNRTKQDLTTAVTWVSSNTAVATISNATGSIGVATSPADGPTGATTIAAALGGVSGQAQLQVTGAFLQSIDVQPSSPILPTGVQQPFTATGTFSDGTTVTTQDMTAFVTWSSSNPATATVSDAPGSKGVAVTVAGGTATITAAFGIVTGSTQLTVQSDELLAIEVTPSDPTIPLSLTKQFTAIGIYENIPPVDLTGQATWSSSNSGVAIISNGVSAGLAKPVAPGTTTITATFSGVDGTTSLTVNGETLRSIAVIPASSSIAKGTTQQFTAIGTFSDDSTLDITQSVVWTSTAPSVAAMSNAPNNEGVATGMGAGSATINAALAGVVSTDATLTVTNASLQSITLKPLAPTIAVKTTLQFTATGNFSDSTEQDLTKSVVWGTSNKNIAAISNAAGTKGVATGVSFGGPITINASFAGKTGSTGLTVATGTLARITIVPNTASITIGSILQCRAVGTYNLTGGGSFEQDLTRQVVWKSLNSNSAATSNGFNSRGLVTAVAAGTAEIRARKPSNTVDIFPAQVTVTL
ncbi:MAG: ATP-dependent DNA ligase [Deltaproteobacteria bacterium]|nr:ATP-dependent DNA ligase [Deltaproteobacteria bacterium]